MSDSAEDVLAIPAELQRVTRQRADAAYRAQAHAVAVRVDKIFAFIMVIQWVAAAVAASIITPRTWIGADSSLHYHIPAAIVIGGCLCLPSLLFVLRCPGARVNRYLISVTQVLFSSLLIHLTGGRIETHFHIFASLAFLALYKEWQVLIPATMVTALDHLVRGTIWPESIFGIATPSSWRWLEHAAWVLCEDAVLVTACIMAQREMQKMANQMGHLSVTRSLVEIEVQKKLVEIKRTSASLRVSERRARSIIDTAHDAFAAIDSNGMLLEWSQRAEFVFGWTAKEAIGQPLGPLLGIEPLVTKLMHRSESDTALREQFDAVVRHRNSHMIPTEAYVSRMKAGDGFSTNIFFHDTTAQCRMQVQLLHAKKMESIGQLAAGIAHEINTPTQYVTDNLCFVQESMNTLESILACLSNEHLDQAEAIPQLKHLAETADLNYLREEIPLAICQALDGVHKITEITKAMKEFSHPGTDIKQMTDLNHLIENSMTVCKNEWKYTATILTHLDPAVRDVPCLPGELSQVLVNLIVNAAQAIGESQVEGNPAGSITIRTRSEGESAYIEVQDNGPGIPEEFLGRIFDPFFTTKEIGKGTGQGLAIAHSVIVNKHGGSISVDSKFGHGTRFVIRLPAEDCSV